MVLNSYLFKLSTINLVGYLKIINILNLIDKLIKNLSIFKGGDILKREIDTSIPIKFEIIEEIVDSRFLRVKIWLCHTGENLNGSYFSKELLETMKDESLANIPILGYITKDSMNEADFNGHEERLIIENGEIKIEYIGKIYGLIPESHNAQFEMRVGDDGIEREFLTCEGLLYTRFSECVDIFNRDESK